MCKTIKSEKEIDEIMSKISTHWQFRWCGGERGPCGCLGCVQSGLNRLKVSITKKEWEDWKSRQIKS
jgi:hypothetical protein